MKILIAVALLATLGLVQAQTSTAPASYQIAGDGLKCVHSSLFLLSMLAAFRQTSYNLIDTLFLLYLRGVQFSQSSLLILVQSAIFPYYAYNYVQ